jgi:hypothetical protein
MCVYFLFFAITAAVPSSPERLEMLVSLKEPDEIQEAIRRPNGLIVGLVLYSNWTKIRTCWRAGVRHRRGFGPVHAHVTTSLVFAATVRLGFVARHRAGTYTFTDVVRALLQLPVSGADQVLCRFRKTIFGATYYGSNMPIASIVFCNQQLNNSGG